MGELANLVMATSTVQGLLEDLSRLATEVVSPRASCGITLRQDHVPLTVVSSDIRAAQLDEVQYGEGVGPCLETLRTGRVTLVANLATERRWGPYSSRALGYGVRSSMSLPLTVNGDARGAMNLYAAAPDAFGADQQNRAGLFAVQASMVLTVAVRQAHQAKLTDQLREALASRAVIDQAIGILMAKEGCDADAAFAILRTTSQHQNRKLRDVAAEIVEAVSGQVPEPTRFADPH